MGLRSMINKRCVLHRVVIYNHSYLFLLLCVYTELNQLEDPRLQWRQEQELMLKEYLVTAQDDLQVQIT